jgi:hypothetical protein
MAMVKHPTTLFLFSPALLLFVDTIFYGRTFCMCPGDGNVIHYLDKGCCLTCCVAFVCNGLMMGG